MISKSPTRIESVHRALTLLRIMTDEGSVSVTEAAHRLGVNPSSAQRLLATLVLDGFARQDDRRRYEPGLALLRPGMLHQMPLRIQARPFLERLSSRVRETVHLVTLVGTEIHHLDGIEASLPLRYEVRTGDRVPAQLTASGKAMLADLPWNDTVSRFNSENRALGPATDHPDMAALREELDCTRAQGFGLNAEESSSGVIGIGVSIGMVDGAMAAFSLTMPTSRYSPEIGGHHRESLQLTVREFREAMSHEVA